MTEYNVACPTSPNFDYRYNIQHEKIVQNHGRINSEAGVYKTIREYFEQFEAELDHSQEIVIRLALPGNEVDFRPKKVGFALPSLITFIGVTDSGEMVQLVQHVSQLSFLLRAAQKLHDQPTRIVFNA
jgi:hypothetical protein